MKYWKEAATIILAARFRHQGPISHSASAVISRPLQQDNISDTPTTTFDYKVLMLQRAHQSSFFAGAQVFPGGGIDEADFSPKWMELFAEAGIKTLGDFGPMVSIRHDRPPMIAADRESPIPSDIAFRICAIRETFEESGVLLLKDAADCRPADDRTPSVELNRKSLDTSDISIQINKEWRQRVHKNAAEFLEMCRELKCLPDVWSLAEWSNWLTPSDMTRKRYDTMFYLCCMETLPPAYQDEKETIQAQWITPSQALAQFAESEFFLPPPQVYELQRLCRFRELSELFKFSQQRALLGCQRYLPVRVNCFNGVLSLLPGDYLRPEQPVLESIPEECIKKLEGTVEDNTDMSKQVHRQTYTPSDTPVCQSLCNILTLPHDHCTPLPYRQCLDVGPQSKL